MSDGETMIRPFANGIEYGAWTTANCDGCAKRFDEATWHFRCDIEHALNAAYVRDGLIPVAIFRRMGRRAADGRPRGPETPCAEYRADPARAPTGQETTR